MAITRRGFFGALATLPFVGKAVPEVEPFIASDGSASPPLHGVSWANDPDTGYFRNVDGKWTKVSGGIVITSGDETLKL